MSPSLAPAFLPSAPISVTPSRGLVTIKHTFLSKMEARKPFPSSDELPNPGASHPRRALRKDQIVTGVVATIVPFGAFLTLPGNQAGLIHISEISNDYVSDVSDHLSVGQQVKVRVLSIDRSTRRIALSLKRARIPTGNGYERAVQLGGDWGHPWGDDPDTRFMDLGPRPPRGPYLWQPDPSLFEPWQESDPR